jgi:hypothetical protein
MSPEIVGPNVFACSEPIHIKYLRGRVTGGVLRYVREPPTSLGSESVPVS